MRKKSRKFCKENVVRIADYAKGAEVEKGWKVGRREGWMGVLCLFVAHSVRLCLFQ